MKKTLVAFSGGLDSTALLFRLLKETDEIVSTFWMDLAHITYQDKSGRTVPYNHELIPSERVVGQRVIDWLSKNIRPVNLEIVEGVKYEPEPADYPLGTSRGWRVLPMLKVAAKIVNRDGLDRFVYGKSPENLRTANQAARDAWYRQWWQDNAPGTTFETPLIERWEGRPHHLQLLPSELRAIVLTCNAPKIVDGEPEICGNCEKCHLTAESERLLKDGVSADMVLDFLLRRRRAGPYIDSISFADKRIGGGVPPREFPLYSEGVVK